MTTFWICVGAVAVAAAVTMAAAQLGNWIGCWLPLPGGGTRCLAGLGFLGLSLYIAGELYWSTIVAAFVMVPLAGWYVIQTAPWLARIRFASRWLWLLVPLGVWVLLLSLIPPMGTGGANDVVGYHLAGPVNWRLTHHVAPLPDNAPTAYPQTIETLDAAAIELGGLHAGVRATGVLSVVFMGLLLAEIWGLAGDLGGDAGAAGLAIAIAGTAPYFVGWASIPFVDIGFAAMALAGARLLARALAENGMRLYVAAGCFFGFALGVKYLGVTLLAASGAVAVLVVLVSGRRLAWAGLACLVAAAIAVGGYWYIRNWVWFGSPLYPYPAPAALSGWLHQRILAPAASQFLQDRMWVHNSGAGRGWGALLLLPFHFTFQQLPFFNGELGLLPLAFAPWAWFAARRQRRLAYWLAWCTALTLAWFFTVQVGRYLMPAVAAVCALAGIGGQWVLHSRGRLTRGLAVVAIVFTMAIGYANLLWANGENVRAVASLFSASRAAALWREHVPFAGAYGFLNSEGGGGVLIADTLAPSYYLNRRYVRLQGEYGERPYGALTEDDVLPRLGSLGVTDVLDVSWPDHPGFHWRAAPPGLHVVYQSAHARVYRVDSAPL
ncbi:MAG TPA: hypothetical protein VN709_08260 [Terriglobales bacterium]|nr:hypothetical protein [Terriglobales bacterium]